MGGIIFGGDAGSKPTSIGIGNNRSPVIGKVPLVQGSDVQKAYNSWLTPSSLGYSPDTMSAPDWYAAYNAATNNGTAKAGTAPIQPKRTAITRRRAEAAVVAAAEAAEAGLPLPRS